MATIIDGKKIASLIKEEIKNQVEEIISKGGRAPHLVAVLVGDDGASLTYVSNKVASCKQVGFKSSLITLPYEIEEEKFGQDKKILFKPNTLMEFLNGKKK